ncbi:MAG: extracellular solute-binding protein [Armatimonadetes bacterium]|nr:extracellular solute-binding protein [Armatimonadota bacterium]
MGSRRTPMKKLFSRIALGVVALLLASLSSADVTLRLSVWDGDKALETIRGICQQFEKDNPGIHVKLENYDYTLYHQKMIITYAAGVAPDVVMMDGSHYQFLATRHALLPLNQFFASSPGFDIKDYYKPIVDSYTFHDQLYILPRDIAPIGLMYYNKKMFKDAGIPYPDGSWTWDFHIRPELKEKDFLWVCQQFVKKDDRGKYIQWGYAPSWPQMQADTYALQLGAYPYDNMAEPTKVLADAPDRVKAFQFAADFANVLHLEPSNLEASGSLMLTTQQMFVQQKIAMYQNGIWDVPNMRKMLKPGTPEWFDWDICLAPAYAGKDGKPVRRSTTGGSGYAIMASTKNPSLAWKLTRYLAGPVGMTAMAKAGIAQPAIRQLALTKGVWLPGPDTPLEEQYPRNRIVTDEAVNYVVFDATTQFGISVSDRYNKGLEILWNGQTTAQKILSENEKIAQQRLDDLRKQEALPPFNWVLGGAIAALIVLSMVAFVYLPERGRRLTRLEKGESKSGYKFLTPWIVGAVIFTLGPMILALLMSFAEWDIIAPAKWRGLANFQEIFQSDPSFYKSMIITAIYTVFSVTFGIIGALGLALLLNQKVRGVALYRTLYYIPSITSGVAGSLIWMRVFNPDNGLLNFLLYGPHGDWPVGVWLSNWIMHDPHKPVDWLQTETTAMPALIIMSVWGIGGGMVIFLAGLQGIPQHYYEAATLDGAGIIARFKSVTLPMLTPTIFFSAITGLIGAFQAFTQAFVISNGTGAPNDATRFFVLHIFSAAFQSARMGYASALGWVLFIIIMVITLIQMKLSRRWVYYESEAK